MDPQCSTHPVSKFCLLNRSYRPWAKTPCGNHVLRRALRLQWTFGRRLGDPLGPAMLQKWSDDVGCLKHQLSSIDERKMGLPIIINWCGPKKYLHSSPFVGSNAPNETNVPCSSAIALSSPRPRACLSGPGWCHPWNATSWGIGWDAAWIPVDFHMRFPQLPLKSGFQWAWPQRLSKVNNTNDLSHSA